MDGKNTTKFKIGIDEVGRGPIAGPVAVCSFLMKDNFPTSPTGGKLPRLRDSKKLSKKQREEWFGYLKKEKEKGNCDFIVSFVSNEMIDKFGISKCIQKALDESLLKLTSPEVLFERSSPARLEVHSGGEEGNGNGARPFQKVFPASLNLYLDGGLHAPKEYVNQETIIKGDELHPVISFASIVAKVSRDKIMENFSKKYPNYGFEKHSGYGTKMHYEMLKKYGLTPIHRRSFMK